MTANSSLLRFVLERLDEEMEMILLNTPIHLSEEVHLADPIRELLGNRDKLLQRVSDIREIVLRAADAMRQEQELGTMPGAVYPPVTVLGGFIIKTVAARYGDHHDYDPVWVRSDAD